MHCWIITSGSTELLLNFVIFWFGDTSGSVQEYWLSYLGSLLPEGATFILKELYFVSPLGASGAYLYHRLQLL